MPKTAQPDVNGIVSKLSGATLGCDPLIVKGKANGTKAPMYRVMGRATGIKEAKDTNGEAIYGLTGSFEGTNLLTGVVMRSGVAYLPPGIHDMILEPLDKEIASSENGAPVALEFAFDIFAVAAPNKSGYTYEAQDLIPATRKDPFSDMKAQLEGVAMPALTDDQKKVLALAQQ
jgi:hypothetical protein